MAGKRISELSNKDIREYAVSHGVPLWRVAESMGITDPTLGRRLRHELARSEKEKYLKTIDEIGGSYHADD